MDAVRWITVFEGSPSRLAVLRGRLEDEGIPTFVPDQTIKTMDPFITGANPLDYRLQVPETDAERAQRLVDVPVVRVVEQPNEAEETVERRAKLALWLTVFTAFTVILAPVGVVAGAAYLLAARKHRRRATTHRLVVAALVIDLLLVLTFAALVLA